MAKYFGWNYPIQSLRLVLPIGLSFHTFQSLSYVIEVYWGRQKVEKHIGIYALYVMFFPQLVAGPIERPQNLLHQFYEKHEFEYGRVINGLKLMVWGMFKKVVIADRIAPFVDKVYNNPSNFKGLPIIIATVLFAIQIYCDFSGYSDIAIGSAKVLGFNLMQNFKRPYFSKSITEFWQRWHISLSSWFRDYVYIPLGGNKVKLPRYVFNLFVTFLISGLWHGANWTFVIWGALNGLYIIIEKLIKRYGIRHLKRDKPFLNNFITKTLKVVYTFSLINFSWIFFRANNISDALYMVKNLFSNLKEWPTSNYLLATISSIDLKSYEFLKILIAILILLIVEMIQRKVSVIKFINLKPLPIRWGIYIFSVIALLFFKSFQNQQFIYFQF
jgi:D-alanyl-lipoteichoic acid acyltransferase DltB (MBOAT superfamily)